MSANRYQQLYDEIKGKYEAMYELSPTAETLIDGIAHSAAKLRVSRSATDKEFQLSIEDYTKIEKSLAKQIETIEKTASKKMESTEDSEAKEVLNMAKAILAIEDTQRQTKLIAEALDIYPGIGEILDELTGKRPTNLKKFKAAKARSSNKRGPAVKKDGTKSKNKVPIKQS